MAAPGSSASGITVLLFGPQALSFPEEYFKRLHSALRLAENAWMREVVAELPSWTSRAAEKFPKLAATPAAERQNSLKQWLDSDVAAPIPFKDVPNALLTPLVVLDHLSQYAQYVELAHVDAGLGTDLFSPQPRPTRTIGFCTGLLSALAVSSASNGAEFRKYGAVSVRLAALIGALVDAEDAVGKYGESTTFSTACHSSEQEEQLQSILRSYPESYISVNYDQNRATITTSSQRASEFCQRLRSSGITATTIGLRGRFHYREYSDDLKRLIELCDQTNELCLPDAINTTVPIQSLTNGEIITEGKLHHIALQEILVEQSQWGQAFEVMSRSSLGSKQSLIVSFGSERCVPPSAMPRVGKQVVYMTSPTDAVPRLSALKTPPAKYSDEDIAVIGMACQVANSDDVDEFWDLNCSGQSQHREVPAERFTFETHWRKLDTKRKWFGNFIKDPDAFDHKFFQKSPREASTQDPQQRIFLQTAYQAVEQSGYFNTPDVDRNIGVYCGVCADEYEGNVACYAPNAFTATGNLKSFIAGKISHYFGWSGPGLTIDTACSASAVAVHQACRAILGGECTAALAGGANVMASPIWFQNLAGASFLSPTGASKPFDEKADGYCRGEGVACVFLKKMSKAVEDGDLVLGSIKSTAVYQNDNCTPIFVPNVPSLSGLFGNVLEKAGLAAKDINLVEAHGTGTPVGDPAEYESILKVLGGKAVRSTPIPLGSVKGLIGHTECTSGVMALIKVLLLIHYGTIPPQASFSKLSSRIKASPTDMLEIYTEQRAWDVELEHRAALINNYGASGSNASMIVTAAPTGLVDQALAGDQSEAKQAFWLSGLDERSLRAYAARLSNFIASRSISSISNLAFNIWRQSNRTLSQALILSSGSIKDLESKLQAFSKGQGGLTITTKPAPRPAILCFGGQISKSIGLDKNVYDAVVILRSHLDRCDAILKSIASDSIYPDIFEKTPIDDPRKLQTMLFSLQYSCARCWIDCGLKPAAVLGHSFGELTALCIAGILSLEDSLRIIHARAQLIKDAWGSDSGAMMAVEGKLDDVQGLLRKAQEKSSLQEHATIACYNGPTTFTLAGPTQAIDEVAECLPSMSSVRGKKLSVSNAFHSSLVTPLEDSLATIAANVTFKDPTIRWERATETSSSPTIGPKFFASHMRDPVYAHHAFDRLHKEFPSAIWIEAGSNSTITKMASKATGLPTSSYFTDVNITSGNGLDKLADTFIGLWKQGLTVPHWAHHHQQGKHFTPLLLPPYQFEKSRHWLELKKPEAVQEQVSLPSKPLVEELPTSLYTFVGYQDKEERSPRFRINTMINKYEELVSGHLIIHTAPICPATVMVELVIEAMMSLRPDIKAAGYQPGIDNVENQAPLCVDPSRMVWLDLHSTTSEFKSWDWQILSANAQGSAKTTHVKGQLVFRSVKDGIEFSRYERLVTHQRCAEILHSEEPDEILQGRNLYKVFSEIVDYGEPYRCLRKLVGKGNASAGRVVKQRSSETWLDAHISDGFSQVGGFWVNCMTDRPSSDLYIAAGFESWIRRPGSVEVSVEADRNSTWDIMACHAKTSDKEYTTDIFVFEAATGKLCEVISGIHYARVSKSMMSKTLIKLSASTLTAAVAPASTAAPIAVPKLTETPEIVLPINLESESNVLKPAAQEQTPKTTPKAAKKEPSKVFSVVADILVELSGVEASAIKLSSQLADIGIDSLVGMEMVHDLEDKFNCSLDVDQMAEVVSVQDVVQVVEKTLGIELQEDGDDSGNVSDSSSGTGSAASLTPSTSDKSDTDTAASSDTEDELQLSPSVVMDAFGEAKKLTDQFITDFGCSGYLDNINPKQTQLCISLILDAFTELGCDIRAAKTGHKLQRISHVPQHGRLVQYLYDVLENEARLVTVAADSITRTATSTPHKSSKQLLDSLLVAFPDHHFANQLAYFCGSRLVEVLRGELDGVKLIFGDPKGRELVGGLYGDSRLNLLFYKQMEDILTRLVSKLPRDSGPLRILEMGAGTGGTTKHLVPLLAKLEVPVEYTFTDLSPSFVAMARRTFKAYPFMKFRAHDIEQEPAEDLLATQHIVIASNAIHATHSLTVSLKNVRKALRPDGMLMVLEMTETLPWVDIIFGLLEGWWLFEDGRKHAISHQSRWEKECHDVGYGHVDWTDGHLPENKIQRIIIAMASGSKHDRLSIPEKSVAQTTSSPDIKERTAVVEEYVQKHTTGFKLPTISTTRSIPSSRSQSVLVTGATGSLGAHVVAALAARSDVQTIFCLNRASRGKEAEAKQRESFTQKGLELEPEHHAKLRILETDSTKPHLGLNEQQYEEVLAGLTGIIHNAWPMSGVRPVRGFEAQFTVMRNLIDLARDAAAMDRLVTLQFISSIAVVGHYPLWSGNSNVPEERVGIESILPNGYGDAKYICERMLDETLHKHPERFRTMSVRLGQVAGNSATGYWNPLEHLSFLIKSSQTLGALPDFRGELSWTPVDTVASTLTELVLGSNASGSEPLQTPHPVYHIDNRVRQPWEEMVPVLARALGFPSTSVLPFEEWVQRVRRFPGSVEKDNPAFKLVDFLDGNFLRMSCGGLLLDTSHTQQHSATFAASGPVLGETATKYVRYWQKTGFLST